MEINQKLKQLKDISFSIFCLLCSIETLRTNILLSRHSFFENLKNHKGASYTRFDFILSKGSHKNFLLAIFL